MKILLRFLFLMPLLAGAAAAADTTPAPVAGAHYVVYLLAGQSNMDGRAAVKDLKGPLAKYAKPTPDLRINFSTGGLHRKLREDLSFGPLRPGCSEKDTHFGPELGFGAIMANALPGKKILLIKVAEGGTSLASDWTPGDPKKLHARFLRFVETTRKKIKETGGDCEIRGMLWMQGESDEKLPAGRYAELLTAFIAKTRAELGLPKLPFLIGQVYDNGHRNTVIADQKAVAKKVPFTAFIDGDGLKTFDKGTHYDAPSQIELGKRFAKEMLRLSPR